jgi:uncharacterized membrane protein
MVRKKEENHLKKEHHPVFRQKLTLGQKAADKIAQFGGSWTFIILFFLFLFSWMGVNSYLLIKRPFDPYPYILLNLTLSCLAALQAPLILMTQNRQAERDRIDAHYDHAINRKAERENQLLQKDMNKLITIVKEIRNNKR